LVGVEPTPTFPPALPAPPPPAPACCPFKFPESPPLFPYLVEKFSGIV
jgi:hypothetical protein